MNQGKILNISVFLGLLLATFVFTGVAQAQSNYYVGSGAISFSKPYVQTATGQIGVVSKMCVPLFDESISVLARLRFTVSAEEKIYKYYNAKNYCDIEVRWGSPLFDDTRSTPINFALRTHRSCQNANNLSHYYVTLDCKGAEFDALRRAHKGQAIRAVVRHEIVPYDGDDMCGVQQECLKDRSLRDQEIEIK